jgi:signal transduction histidine kinase
MLQSADTYLHLPRRRYFSALEIHAAAVGTVAAVVLLVGYGFNVEQLRTILPGFPEMRPKTAGSFMLLSVSYMLSLRGSRAATLLSSAVAAGTVVWLLEGVISGWNAERDGQRVLFGIQGTLLSIVFSCAAMLVINHAPRWRIAAGIMALLAVTPALYRIFTLLVFWGAPPQAGSLLSSMGIHTAVLVVWFMGVCVLLHPRLGFGAVALQASLRGRLLRRALPFVVALPVGAAVSGLLLALAFGWTAEVLFALTATVAVTLSAGLIWWLSSLVEEWQREANEQAARLARANEALEQYASSAAHDLKAPARHVMLYGELLDDALARGDLDAARRHAHAIRDSALELPKIIDGMLDYSRSAFTRITLTENSLSELVQAACAAHAKDLEAAGAKVTVVNELRLQGDSTLMTTVFQNLIGNALKNRRKDRPLSVRIDGVRDETGWRISVEDNGVGFEPDFAAVAFNPLARGINAAGEGSGIGLSTCRTIIQSHGGEIRIDPSFRNGARVEFTLPFRSERSG